jgi:hypothetical protein
VRLIEGPWNCTLNPRIPAVVWSTAWITAYAEITTCAPPDTLVTVLPELLSGSVQLAALARQDEKEQYLFLGRSRHGDGNLLTDCR